MRFSYDEIRSGNAVCTLEIDNQTFTFHPAFHTDALGDFVTYLASVHPLCKLSWKDGAFHKTNGGITWRTNPVLTRWEFRRNFEDLQMTITEIQNPMIDEKKNKKLPRKVVTTTCNFNEFVLCVVKELDRLIKRRGLLGYRQAWQTHTFPLDAFLALKHACLYNRPFELTKNHSGTSLEEELVLLMKDID
ncbi:hypothetical protein [Priestia taiwanensis]|uniref:Uncharacterized protein n=1 Tax=Priestia taiwanensis TaxID=1347902 RepID=A0A917EP26_9BACI|nr:hypothetical protein [Priestia taiwanensis]MBM7362330.1 hypothetical protein [Priestia taiwanensis]GGE61302.1 hypothetical protein GCM10007140_09530 [Priestia taiwanensis]